MGLILRNLRGINYRLSDPTQPTIGAALGGGYYAGTIDYSGGAGTQKYYLIISPISTEQTSISYGITNAISTSMIDGFTNTNNINNVNYPAAQYARALTTGGFTDWYIPAYYEMQILLYNLKSYNINNFVGNYDSLPVGANIYAVPQTSQYTTTVPAQISVAIFQQGGAQALDSGSFAGAGYWTSTQRGGIFDMQNITGTAQNNGGWGNFGSSFKNDPRGLRCIRKVLAT